MSQGELEVVRAAFARWEKGDVDGMLEFAAEDVEWLPSVWSGAGLSYHGHEGVRKWASQFAGPERRIEVAGKEFRQGSSGIAVIGEVTEFRGEAPAATIAVGWVVELEAGKVVRAEGFSDPNRALRVAGVWD